MASHPLAPARCYEALRARDRRFDGVFFVGVVTTRIYCRPVCTVRLPRFDRCRFFRHAASAEHAGFRPCLRCRPELAPGLSKVDAVRRVATQVAERIRAGALWEGDLEDLAAELELSSRQLRRVVEAEYGVSPSALAQTHRLHLAKQLLTDTSLRMIDVAFASGFSSVRRFNASFREHYRMTPSDVRRAKCASGDPTGPERGVVLRLGYRPPLAWTALIEFLASRGSPRVERTSGEVYRRILVVDDVRGWIEARDEAERSVIRVEISPSLLPKLVQVQTKLRALFDLDADPHVIEDHLASDAALAPRVKASPGLRVPGAVDGFELAVRTVLGQQIAVKAASTLFGRLVERFGHAVESPYEGLDRCMPSASQVARLCPGDLRGLGWTEQRARTVLALAREVATGALGFEGRAASDLLARLVALPGIGPWTASYVAMRALGDPDALPLADLGLMRALELERPAELAERARRWSPWRAYAAIHLWSSQGSGG